MQAGFSSPKHIHGKFLDKQFAVISLPYQNVASAHQHYLHRLQLHALHDNQLEAPDYLLSLLPLSVDIAVAGDCFF
jgi:hypothetical protein